MEIDVGQQRRCAATLRRPGLHRYPLPVLQHARVQPFLDEPHHAPVRYPVLDKLDQPTVVDGIEKATEVQIEHPVHLFRHHSVAERLQRLMRAAPGPEPIRKPQEVSLVDGVEHLDRGALDQLIFQRRHPERSLPPVGLGDVHPTHRLGPVRSTLEPIGKLAEIVLQLLAVVPPRLAVHARRRLMLQTEVGSAQPLAVIDVVQERGEPHLPILSCCLTYSLQRTGRTWPALGPGRVLLGRVPLGQSPSLHRLRRRLPGLVRRLHRYYGTVRLPGFVHRRRASLDFPTRPAAPSAAGELRTSRFSCEVFPYVHGVCDRAGPGRISRWRCARWCLPTNPTASASRTKLLSRLNTRPARTPVKRFSHPLTGIAA